MSFIFFDESGDLGFDFTKEKTSKFFIVTFLLAENKNPVEKIVKKIFHEFPSKILRSHDGVLHCTKEDDKTRRKVLSML